MSLRIKATLLALVLATPVVAATRLTYDIQGVPTPLEWAPTSFPLPYEVDKRLADLRPDAVSMIDKAFATWTTVPDANIRFESRGITSRISDMSAGRIVVSLADDLFRGQGALAMTTYTFDKDTGHFTDADIMVDSSLMNGKFNIQMALQHEIGHVLGLDHSGVISAVMYPYVSNSESAGTFDSDDRIAIATSYPMSDPTLVGATITGRVMGDQGGIFGAQVVAVSAQGQPVATGLTSANGEFSISGLPAGRYRIYAEPLDGPVDPQSLRGTWRDARAESFPTQFFAEKPLDVENGRVYGNLLVNASGPMGLNPKWVGVCATTSHTMSLSSSAATVRPGETVKLAIGGDGFTSGMTQFEVLSPSFRRVSDFDWSSNYVTAQFEVAADAPSGSAVLLVRSGNETATLTGGLKIYRQAKGRAARK